MEDNIKNVIVGSMNRNKVNGVREILEPLGYQVYGKESPSNVSNQPKSDAETITGAVNRAYNLKEGFLRIGLEAGVHYESGVMYLVNWGALVDEAMDVYFEEHGINEREGAIGFFTNNYLPRQEIFTHITKLLYGQYTYFKKRGVK